MRGHLLLSTICYALAFEHLLLCMIMTCSAYGLEHASLCIGCLTPVIDRKGRAGMLLQMERRGREKPESEGAGVEDAQKEVG
jgi:hypothetical protein